MEKACIECGILKKLHGKGLCHACAERLWRHTHPEALKARSQRAYYKTSMKLGRKQRKGPLEIRFLRRVLCDVKTHCWLWQGTRNYKGYGKMSCGIGMMNLSAHRVAYHLYKGPIPDGLQIDHLCRVRHCVNPDHLEVVTPYENFLRGNRGSAGGVVMARKTHCLRGHPYNEENTYRHKNHRYCRQCHNERRRTGARPARVNHE